MRVGCVSYLNAKPLIDGYDGEVRYAVPAELLSLLEAGDVDVALCPVIDYYRSRVPLVVVPVGGIGCDGPTWTVRAFSKVPFERVTTVDTDTDSHTSVALLRVLLDAMHGRRPSLRDLDLDKPWPETVLLIGDKVVTHAPEEGEYEHRLDLGEAWKRATGLPFVFATWLAREGAELGTLPVRLDRLRRVNAGRVDEMVLTYAQRHGWPMEQAREYLGSVLRYELGGPQLQAIERFASMAHGLGLIPAPRELRTVSI